MADDEAKLARAEILRRCTKAGLDETEMDTLLSAYEAGALRTYAAILEETGKAHLSAPLKGWAMGLRPRNWRRLLPNDPGAAS